MANAGLNSPADEPSVELWETELVARKLPTICTVTGTRAAGWVTYELSLDPTQSNPAETLTAWLPASASVRRRNNILVSYWMLSLLGWAVLFLWQCGSGSAAETNPTMMAWGGVVVASWLLGFFVISPLVLRRITQPRTIAVGAVGSDRWLLIGPVHPAFANAVRNLPRTRPPSSDLGEIAE